MGVLQYLAGTMRIRLTSADLTGALAALSEGGVGIRDACPENELSVCFTISRPDYKKVEALAARRGDLIRPVRRRGAYWDLKGLRRRPVLAVGILLFLVMQLYLPGRILIFEVQGNSSIPTNQILETARACGMSFGASRREVRSEKVKNALLEAMPELAWAGVNTYGCRAMISVREREPEPEEPETEGIAHLVAARDAYILSCDVTGGSALCTPGQAVKAGEVLISGYTDCGLCITATRAEGEVMAVTSHSLTALTPAECMKKGEETGEWVKYSLIVGKIRINFDNNSGILDASCGRMVTNYHLTLPGGYRLPVTLTKETITESELTSIETDGSVLQGYAQRYLGTQMIAGTVKEAVELVAQEGGVWTLRGEYACTEMIARVQAEQNGELHETD